MGDYSIMVSTSTLNILEPHSLNLSIMFGSGLEENPDPTYGLTHFASLPQPLDNKLMGHSNGRIVRTRTLARLGAIYSDTLKAICSSPRDPWASYRQNLDWYFFG